MDGTVPLRHEDLTKVNDSVWYSYSSAFWYIQKTTDGGQTWDTVLSSGIDTSFYAVFPYCLEAPTENTVFVGCQAGIIFRSRDGGQSWEKYQFPNLSDIDKEFEIEAMAFKDSLHGIVAQIATMDRVYRTDDGGDSWKELKLPISYNWEEFRVDSLFYDSTHITFRIGTIDGPTVLRSFDDGKTWTTITDALPERMKGLQVHSKDTLYCTPQVRHPDHASSSLRYDQFCASYDGGQTWEYLIENFTYLKSFGLGTFYVYEDGRHIFVTGDARLFFSNNAGKTWYMQEDRRGKGLHSITVWNIEERLEHNKFRMVFNDWRVNYELTIDPSFFATSVAEQQQADSFRMKVVPNLLYGDERVNIHLPPLTTSTGILRIVDSRGRLVYTQNLSLPQYSLQEIVLPPLSGVATGQYYILVEVGNVLFRESIVVR
jgi:photosystem II stability/assembly factor-like uncharacterized protein